MTPDTWHLVHAPSGAVVAHVTRAEGWWAQGWGVIGWPALPPGQGLWLPGVAAIHTLFVRFPLDVLFLDAQYRTVRVARPVPPWTPLVRARAHHTIELGAGTLEAHPVQPGDRWKLTPSPAGRNS